MNSGGGERQTPRFQSSAESAGSGSLRWRKRRPIEDDDEHEDENPNFDFLKLFEVGFNLGPPPFQERRQRKVFAKIRNIFVDCESRAIGRKFKENVIWFAEVQAPEIIAVNLSAVRNARISQSAGPGMMSFLIGDPEGDVVNAPGSRTIRCKIRPNPDMQFCPRTASGDFVDLNAELRFSRIRVLPGRSHPQNLRKEMIRQIQLGNRDGNRSEASDLVFCRYRTA